MKGRLASAIEAAKAKELQIAIVVSLCIGFVLTLVLQPAINPVSTANAQSFSDNFDSGCVFLPSTPTALTTKTVLMLGLHFNNTKNAAHTITFTNAAGNDYLTSFSLPANSTYDFPCGVKGFPVVGITWSADAANSVTAQVIGLK
jgi:hypothetical protein